MVALALAAQGCTRLADKSAPAAVTAPVAVTAPSAVTTPVAVTAPAPVAVTATAPESASVRVRGVVKEVKPDARTFAITLKKQGEDMSFAVGAGMPLKSGDKLLELTDLKVGDKVRVDYTEAAGKKTAVKVRIEDDAT